MPGRVGLSSVWTQLVYLARQEHWPLRPGFWVSINEVPALLGLPPGAGCSLRPATAVVLRPQGNLLAKSH